MVLAGFESAHAQATSHVNDVWEVGLGLGAWVPHAHGASILPEASVRVAFPSRSRSLFEMVLSVPFGFRDEERTVFYSLQGKTLLRQLRPGERLSLTWGAMGYYSAGPHDSFFSPTIVGVIGIAIDWRQRRTGTRVDSQLIDFRSVRQRRGWQAGCRSCGDTP